MNESKVTKIVNTLELTRFIESNGTQCRFVSIIAKTPVVKIRSGNPWGAGKATERGLYSFFATNGLVNANYNRSVCRRIAEKHGFDLKDVQYVNGPIWYEHLLLEDGKALPLVRKKSDHSQLYLQYFPHRTKSVYVNEAGATVPKEDVKPWLYAPSKQSEYKPKTRTVHLQHILCLKASGEILESPNLSELENLLESDAAEKTATETYAESILAAE